MKIIILSILATLLMSASESKNSIHSFKVKDNAGKEFDLSTLKGKKVLIVNVASKCGLTPQYEQLQAIYTKYKDQNFEIIGFPSNDFMGQEPGTNEEIATFCSVNYGVTFKIMDKVTVKGDSKCELYKFLTKKELNGLEDNSVQWNFQKYLINEDGTLAKVVGPRISPDNKEIIDWIESK
jgi:glutathione peroxidase